MKILKYLLNFWSKGMKSRFHPILFLIVLVCRMERSGGCGRRQ